MNNTISLEQAVAMTTLFRSQKENILQPVHQGKNILPRCESFDRAAFDKVLSQPGCTGIRIYFGMTKDLQVRTILVGVNSKNEDMLPMSSTADDDGIIIEEGGVCPPLCPPPSALNP